MNGFGWQEIDKTLDLGYIRVAGLHHECKSAVLFDPPNFCPHTMTHVHMYVCTYIQYTYTLTYMCVTYERTEFSLMYVCTFSYLLTRSPQNLPENLRHSVRRSALWSQMKVIVFCFFPFFTVMISSLSALGLGVMS